MIRNEVLFIDTHAHLNLSAFAEDALAVAERCAGEEVVVINVGTNLESSERAVELAGEAGNCFAIAGLHPTDALSEGGFDAQAFGVLAKEGKVVGIGECGLDYFHDNSTAGYEAQEEAFLAQIELANEFELPLMIHTRGPALGQESPTGRSVYADVYELLKKHAQVPFNIHFFAGTKEEAARFFDLGGSVSFTGVVTFPKSGNYAEVIKNAPLDRLHAETDCPYVAPVPYRGQRAEPWMVKEVYKKIATIRGEDEEMVREQLVENARRQYGL